MDKPKWFVAYYDGQQRHFRLTSDEVVRNALTILRQHTFVDLSTVLIYPTSAEMTAEEWLKKEAQPHESD